MGSKEWPPCTPSQENKSTQEGQRKVEKYTKWDQEKPNQKPMEVLELISTRERQGATPTNQEPKQKQNSTKQWTDQSPTHQESNPTRARIRIQQKPAVRPGKTNSQIKQNQLQSWATMTAKLNKTNNRIQQEEQSQIQQNGGCQPNVD